MISYFYIKKHSKLTTGVVDDVDPLPLHELNKTDNNRILKKTVWEDEGPMPV